MRSDGLGRWWCWPVLKRPYDADHVGGCRTTTTYQKQVLEQRFERLQADRDRIFQQFQRAIYDVKQKCGFKNLLIRKKMARVEDSIEKKEAQLNEIISQANLEGSQIAAGLDDIIQTKNKCVVHACVRILGEKGRDRDRDRTGTGRHGYNVHPTIHPSIRPSIHPCAKSSSGVVFVCVRACVRACMRACVRVCARKHLRGNTTFVFVCALLLHAYVFTRTHARTHTHTGTSALCRRSLNSC